MNTKILLMIIVVGAASTMAYGIMSTEMAVDFANIGFFTSIEMFEGGVECACVDPVTGEPPYEMGNCITQAAIDDDPSLAPLYIGDVGNMLCTWETAGELYGGNYLNKKEGCYQEFWIENSKPDSKNYQWPDGYMPKYYYNDIFQTSFVSNEDEEDEEEDEDDKKKDKRTKETKKYFKKIIKKLLDKKNINKQTTSSLEWIQKFIEENDNSSNEIDKLFDYMEFLEGYSERNRLLSKHKQYINLIQEELEKAYPSGIAKIYKEKDDDDKKNKGLTLYDVLKHVSSKAKNKKVLASESTAALLNSAHEEITYPYKAREVISMTQKALASGDYEETINKFREYNRMGEATLCPLR